ncbi:MAG: RtcB family protein [Actinobacteria bacterium]|nr:MAG: RtcB family protein [Actinomycetota bacterium]
MVEGAAKYPEQVAGLRRIGPAEYELDPGYKQGMRVPGRLFADERLLEMAIRDKVIDQVANVAFLPGIVDASLAMPDMHWGYGFPIGGVAAMRLSDGVVSPGGVGFDIACGVRILKTNLVADEVRHLMETMVHELARSIPKGVGSRGRVKTPRKEMEAIFAGGVTWAVGKGYAWPEDMDHIEQRGTHPGANPDAVSEHAYARGENQVGTLGAGNHFLEIQRVDQVYDKQIAEKLGLFRGQLVVMIHSGSRGTGHQVCTDYLKVMDRVARQLGIHLPDRQLACAPIDSKEGQDYLSAMACAANYALVNRQLMAHWVRRSFESVFKKSARDLGMDLLFDVSHNIAKIEEHDSGGDRELLCVHRKGATRAFGPGHPDLPEEYGETGQPVVIPGDMGRASFILVGTETAMKKSFGSTCHGAGRVMSRKEAKRRFPLEQLKKELQQAGVVVEVGSKALLPEEAPMAYKDAAEVVEVCEAAGISHTIARVRPLGVLKG